MRISMGQLIKFSIERSGQNQIVFSSFFNKTRNHCLRSAFIACFLPSPGEYFEERTPNLVLRAFYPFYCHFF